MVNRIWIAAAIIVAALEGAAFAAHPLITDDTGTQGKGGAQFEFIGAYGIDREAGISEKDFEISTVPFLSYGLSDTVDIVFGMPYDSITVEDAGSGTKDTVHGITDASIELKARFYEQDGLSFAIKPGITVPTGDENKGLGNGRATYHAFLITTRELQPWVFHLNLGYIRNQFQLRTDEDANRKDIWHASLAAQVETSKNLKVVTNIGAERNPDKTSATDPAFVLGGFIYSITADIDLDAGVKYGLNRPETDISYLAGITWRL